MIRLGVIGHGGRISGVIKDYLREEEPDLRVVGIVDPDREGATGRLDPCDRDAVCFYDSLVRWSGRPDRMRWPSAHAATCNTPYAIEAAAYDLPLYLEKPVAINMGQAVALERAFENSRCSAIVSFPLRVSPLCEMARHHIANGAIGTPEHVLGVNYVPYGTVYFDNLYRNYPITQGLFIQKATHDFDYLMYLMSSPVLRIAAMKTCGRVFGGNKPAGLRCSQCDEARIAPKARARASTTTRAAIPGSLLRVWRRYRHAGNRHERRLLQRADRVCRRRPRHLHAGVLHATRCRPPGRHGQRLPGHREL